MLLLSSTTSSLLGSMKNWLLVVSLCVLMFDVACVGVDNCLVFVVSSGITAVREGMQLDPVQAPSCRGRHRSTGRNITWKQMANDLIWKTTEMSKRVSCRDFLCFAFFAALILPEFLGWRGRRLDAACRSYATVSKTDWCPLSQNTACAIATAAAVLCDPLPCHCHKRCRDSVTV